ncbi:MAG TPA: YdeI/OmpD-associated family protein [Candidatus Saccharimonadia bacterium]|nr:YdeI/OmpD-associated family protein [Candidatus Saccharimonadia bacterium]
MSTNPDLPILAFATPVDWEQWLAKNSASSGGLWLKIAKKSSHTPSVTYPQALDIALCYGWIDGQKNALDDHFWLQKFTPRRPKSAWSEINAAKAEQLITAGKMHPAGLAQVEVAKQDGRWAKAYASQSTATVPDDLAVALEANPKAKAFFAAINGSNRYAILYRIQDAKRPETRAARITKFVDMLARGETLL